MTAIDQGKNIKAVFFDIDGTLLSHKTGEVPQSTIDAIEEIRSRGILAIVATGRHMSEYEGLPVAKIKFDGYLMLNGQLLHDSDRKVYSGTAIDPGEMEILARIFSAKKIPFILIGENQRYINYVNDTVVETQSQTQGTIPSIEEYKGEKVYQICAFVPENQKILLDNLLDECHVSSWHESGIDIIPKGGGKGSGVKAFVVRLNDQHCHRDHGLRRQSERQGNDRICGNRRCHGQCHR